MNSSDTKEKREKFLLEQVPEKRRIMVSRAFGGTCSPRAAIKAHCFVCSGMDADEAKNCSVILCPLYEYNSYRKAAVSYEVGAESSASEEADGENADAR